ncbi:50S ribosomal protein L11 methyltransferase [Alcanivorax sp. 1008]|uniref:50S ribosomal protein L11 methyltransferase n=1 Tax=Alcanivorax sp. 1008 TaxID=2816853 RepID=UPI001D95E61A|nr:50S ribosomal protein L11 methyltransferase [Alcanivorax sp. 1008]MCC1496599.1 50S ribosomal protein L11 methyltransferase [Alcanivorax sp. 1008]
MAWLQIHIPSDAGHAEPLQDLLAELGAEAVTCTDAADQPIFEPPPGATPLWQQTVVTALFDRDTDANLLRAAIESALGPLADFHQEIVEDQPWERAWMEDFKPMQFGQRLWIVPSWSEAPDPQAINIKLDPGLAFGTGTHETTSLCLSWLDSANVANKQVLDFGCGSGILAIAALLLGAESAVGCDLDPQALLATNDNAAANGVDGKLRCYLPEAMPAGDYDLVLANILAGPLVELAPLLTGYCRSGGNLLLSGILADQAESVMAAYGNHFELSAVAQKNDWVRIHGVRR